MVNVLEDLNFLKHEEAVAIAKIELELIRSEISKELKSFKCRLSQYCRKYKSIYDEPIIYLSQISFCFN